MYKKSTLGNSPAPIFVADFPSEAPKFNQRTIPAVRRKHQNQIQNNGETVESLWAISSAKGDDIRVRKGKYVNKIQSFFWKTHVCIASVMACLRAYRMLEWGIVVFSGLGQKRGQAD